MHLSMHFLTGYKKQHQKRRTLYTGRGKERSLQPQQQAETMSALGDGKTSKPTTTDLAHIYLTPSYRADDPSDEFETAYEMLQFLSMHFLTGYKKQQQSSFEIPTSWLMNMPDYYSAEPQAKSKKSSKWASTAYLAPTTRDSVTRFSCGLVSFAIFRFYD